MMTRWRSPCSSSISAVVQSIGDRQLRAPVAVRQALGEVREGELVELPALDRIEREREGVGEALARARLFSP